MNTKEIKDIQSLQNDGRVRIETKGAKGAKGNNRRRDWES